MDSGTVLLAAATVIAALLGIIGTMLGMILNTTKRSARRMSLVHEQVANNHVDENGDPINMRDDLDEKFEGLATLVKGVADTQEAQGRDIGGMRADIRQVRVDQSQDRVRVTAAADAAAIAATKAEKAAADAVLALERTGEHPIHRKPKPITRGES